LLSKEGERCAQSLVPSRLHVFPILGVFQAAHSVRYPEVAAHFARLSKDGGRALVAHPSRLGINNAEHLRMTTLLPADC
jgi:hypothetical protein